MERDKMVEELACKIERIFIEESRKEENKMYPWQDLPVFHSICLRIATDIIPEDVVVLTKEKLIELNEKGFTFDTTTGGKINLIEMAREIERKETAREIKDWYDEHGMIYTCHTVSEHEIVFEQKEVEKMFKEKFGIKGIIIDDVEVE